MHHSCAGKLILVSEVITLQNKVTLDKPELEKKIKKEKTTGWKEHAKGETRMNTEEKNNEQKLLLLCPLPSQQCPKGEGLQWEQEGPGEEEEQILCTGRNAEDWSAQKYAQEQVV